MSWREQKDLAAYVEKIASFDEPTLFRMMPEMREMLSNILEPATFEAIAGFMKSDGTIIRVCGLPFDKALPETPYGGYIENEEIPVATVMQLALFAVAGIMPISYNRENRGLLFRHVVPTKTAASKVSSHGSKFTLDMHVSNPILPITPEATDGVSASPEILSFYGLRSDPDVFTEVVELDEVLEQLPQHVIEALQEKKYLFRMPSSFGGSEVKGPFSIIGMKDGKFFNRTDMDTVIPTDYAALQVLNAFMQATKKVRNLHRFQLGTGDMLFFKNQRTLHARQKFEVRYNGLDRWMMRLYGTATPERHHWVPDQEPFVGATY